MLASIRVKGGSIRLVEICQMLLHKSEYISRGNSCCSNQLQVAVHFYCNYNPYYPLYDNKDTLFEYLLERKTKRNNGSSYLNTVPIGQWCK